MGQAICRCGQPLEVPPGEISHVVCPTCAAKVRIVRKSRSGSAAGSSAGDPGSSGDGYIRFACPCGRKLKVSLLERPSHGKCPDCGRVVPVPADTAAVVSAESPTAEMPAIDQARLDAWAGKYLAENAGENGATPRRAGSGLRICPKCGKPIHMGADACRTCGVVVPKR